MSKPIYDPNTDYSLKILEAEKNGDLQAAASLERLRNEKIDDMGLSYSKTYKYNDDPAATYTIPKSRYAGGFDASGYDSMRQSAAAYYDSAYRQQEQLLQQQREQAQQQYDRAAQSQYVAYAQAQQALPQQLAAAGLTGTGYTETAAAQLAAAYQSALGRNESARQQALSDIAAALSAAAWQRDQGKARAGLDIQGQQLSAAQQYQAAAQAQDNVLRQYYQSVLNNAWNNAVLESELTGRYRLQPTVQQQSAQYQAALQRMQAVGYVLPQDAAILGIPAGTPTADYRGQLTQAAQGWARLQQG